MKIPDVVLQEASEAMEMLEGTLVYLGKIGWQRCETGTSYLFYMIFCRDSLEVPNILPIFAA